MSRVQHLYDEEGFEPKTRCGHQGEDEHKTRCVDYVTCCDCLRALAGSRLELIEKLQQKPESEPENPDAPTIHLQTTSDSLTKCGKSVPWALSTTGHASANCVPCLRARIREIAEARLDAAEARGANRGAPTRDGFSSILAMHEQAVIETAALKVAAYAVKDLQRGEKSRRRHLRAEKMLAALRGQLLDLACGESAAHAKGTAE